jgi:hypothetical protein
VSKNLSRLRQGALAIVANTTTTPEQIIDSQGLFIAGTVVA